MDKCIGVLGDFSDLIEETLEEVFDGEKIIRSSDDNVTFDRELELLQRIAQLETELNVIKGKKLKPLTKTLSRKQSEVLNVIHQYIIEKGHPPTIREIGTLVDLKSPSTVYGH
jgi:hypothetical protein